MFRKRYYNYVKLINGTTFSKPKHNSISDKNRVIVCNYMTGWQKTIVYVSVCILSVPQNSYIVQQTGTQSTFGTPLVVECIPGYRISGFESNDVVTTSIQCNERGLFDLTPKCEPKGKGRFELLSNSASTFVVHPVIAPSISPSMSSSISPSVRHDISW